MILLLHHLKISRILDIFDVFYYTAEKTGGYNRTLLSAFHFKLWHRSRRAKVDEQLNDQWRLLYIKLSSEDIHSFNLVNIFYDLFPHTCMSADSRVSHIKMAPKNWGPISFSILFFKLIMIVFVRLLMVDFICQRH